MFHSLNCFIVCRLLCLSSLENKIGCPVYSKSPLFVEVQKRNHTFTQCKNSHNFRCRRCCPFSYKVEWMSYTWYIVWIPDNNFKVCLQAFFWVLHVICIIIGLTMNIFKWKLHQELVFCWTRLWMNGFLLVKVLKISHSVCYYNNSKPVTGC